MRFATSVVLASLLGLASAIGVRVADGELTVTKTITIADGCVTIGATSTIWTVTESTPSATTTTSTDATLTIVEHTTIDDSPFKRAAATVTVTTTSFLCDETLTAYVHPTTTIGYLSTETDYASTTYTTATETCTFCCDGNC